MFGIAVAIIAIILICLTVASEWQLARKEARAEERRQGKLMRRRIARYTMRRPLENPSNLVLLDTFSRKVEDAA